MRVGIRQLSVIRPEKKMRRTGQVLCVTSALILLSSLPALAQRAPDFTLKDLSGRSHKLSGYFPEHIVLLNFWATWCVPCVKELPYLQQFQDRYAATGLQVLTIDIDGPDRLATVSGFMARYGYTLPVLLDTESQVVSVYNPRLNLPYSVLLDRQGTIRYAHQGYSPGDELLLEEKIAALLAEPEAKPKSKTSVQANESFLLRVPKEGTPEADPASGYNEILDQLDVTVAHGSFQAGARADLNLDFSPSDADVRLAKRYAQYSASGFRARAGDFYTSLGRGLAFSLTKVFEEEGLDYVIDTTVDGGQVSAAAGAFSGGAFGGWIDRPDDRSLRDTVIGGNIGWTNAWLGTFRVQGLGARLEPGSQFGNRSVGTGSFGFEMPGLGGWADLYGEFSLIRRTLYDAAAPVDGHGLYLGSRLRRGRFTLLLEMKDYRELNFEYARPPLLEPEQIDILADQFDLDRTDITSYSANIDYYAPASATLIYARLLNVLDNPVDHPQYGSYVREIGHVFAGVEKTYAGGGYINGLAGWRRETASSVAFLRTAGETFHDQINVLWPIGRGWSLEGDWKHKVFDEDGYDYYEIRSALSLHRSPRWVLSVLYERTTEPAMVALYDKKDWWAGRLEFRFGAGHAVRLFAGSTKGGVKCAGGICRLFPPFEGVRLEAFLRF